MFLYNLLYNTIFSYFHKVMESSDYISDSFDDLPDALPSISHEPLSDNYSILALLDEKNQTIATLKKQLQNQKLQLMYYFRKYMDRTKVFAISKSCSPEIIEENTAVVLAVNNFKRQMGIKSNMRRIYDRMCDIDEQISHAIIGQEFILKEICKHLCEEFKNSNRVMNELVFLHQPSNIDLMNFLLEATINLRKRLDMFRICSNKLMAIEEERNVVVEQVCSLSAEQRMNTNLLLNSEMENIKLKNEIKKCIKGSSSQSESLKAISDIEEKLTSLQNQLKSMFNINEQDSHIKQMLQEVNCEALFLLEMTKAKKDKFQKKQLAEQLNKEQVIGMIKLAAEKKEQEKSISNGQEEVVPDETDTIQIQAIEFEQLKTELKTAAKEKEELELKVSKLELELEESKKNYGNHILQLRKERDALKLRVNDLEAIRDASSQLFEKQPKLSVNEKKYILLLKEKDQQINNLQKHNQILNNNYNDANTALNNLNKKLELQDQLIKNMKPPETKKGSNPQETEKEYRNTKLLSDTFSNDTTYLATFYDEMCKEEIVITEVSSWKPDDFSKGSNTHSPVNRSRDIVFYQSQNVKIRNPNPGCVKIYSKNKHLPEVIKTLIESSGTELTDLKRIPSLKLEIECKLANSGQTKSDDDFKLLEDCKEEIESRTCAPIRRKNRRKLFKTKDLPTKQCLRSQKIINNKMKVIEVFAKPKFPLASSSEENLLDTNTINHNKK